LNTSKTKRFVKHKLKDEGPTVWIGKEGLTEQSLCEIEKQLKKNKMLKIKILQTALLKEAKKQFQQKPQNKQVHYLLILEDTFSYSTGAKKSPLIDYLQLIKLSKFIANTIAK